MPSTSPAPPPRLIALNGLRGAAPPALALTLDPLTGRHDSAHFLIVVLVHASFRSPNNHRPVSFSGSDPRLQSAK